MTELTRPLPTAAPTGVRLLELLELEVLDRDLFRAGTVFDESYPLYGGQVAAQALIAAGRTVAPDRVPHSLHGYFLRGGDARRPTVFRVDRDRDGRSFSARRVVAVQNGEIIFSMSASFHAQEDGIDRQVRPAPDAGRPADLPPLVLPRLCSIEGRRPAQPCGDVLWPTRVWARHVGELPDAPLVHAAVLTYLSDMLTGLAPFMDGGRWMTSSLDHAVWFHRPARLDRWVLLDLVPQSTAGGRGWYTGTVSSQDGVQLASLTQESLFRRRRTPPRDTADAGADRTRTGGPARDEEMT